jgi:hypothetical protein
MHAFAETPEVPQVHLSPVSWVVSEAGVHVQVTAHTPAGEGSPLRAFGAIPVAVCECARGRIVGFVADDKSPEPELGEGMRLDQSQRE